MSGFKGFVPHKNNNNLFENSTLKTPNSILSSSSLLANSPSECYQRIESFVTCREHDCIEKMNILMKSSPYTFSIGYSLPSLSSSSDDVSFTNSSTELSSSSSLFPSLL